MNGSLYLITRPDDDVVTLGEAKAQLRITTTDNDDMIQALIDAAVAQIDPASGGWLGRAIRPQTWELRGNGFPCYYEGCGYTRNFHRAYACELPYPPLISVDSVKYDDGEGVERTLVENTGYRVFGLGSIGKASITPVYNGSWPSSVRADAESVRIRFTCGYPIDFGNSPPTDILPVPIKQAVLLMVKHLWGLGERNLFVSAETVDGVGSRNFVVSENAAIVMKAATENLLAPYRVYD
jgi:uncharacterized phiE125 gp8 family phage protein